MKKLQNVLWLFSIIFFLFSCGDDESNDDLALTVTSPNGAENWTVASINNITWTTTGTVANVKLEYTTNGSTWTVITASTANTGTYAWTVPNAPSTTCKVRVTDVSNASVTDMSNANFTISGGSGTVNDYDGNVYHTVTIGTQVWMVENLKTTHYRNGTAITNVTDNTAWTGLTTGAYCNYNNDTNNATTYGRMYNWYAVSNSNNIAPSGWHVASDAEWTTLTTFVGGESIAGTKLKSTSGWNSAGNGTDNYNFTALPCGYRGYLGAFNGVGSDGAWWSSTELNAAGALSRSLNCYYANVFNDVSYKMNGYSVRCVRN